MKQFATKGQSAQPAQYAIASLRPKSEVWIQQELDVAILNAEKNRSIQDVSRRTTRSPSSSKTSVLKSASSPYRAYPSTTSRAKSVTLNVDEKTSTKLQKSNQSTFDQESLPISKKRVGGEQTPDAGSLQTQIQCMIGEWSYAIKQAIFQEEIELNEDTRHTPQVLVLM